MTPDRQLFEKVKRDGECWHDPDVILAEESYEGYFCPCVKCGKNATNPDFTTWEGFGWLWERVNEKEWWWKYACQQIYAKVSHANLEKEDYDGNIPVALIHPTKFRYSLIKFLGIKED